MAAKVFPDCPKCGEDSPRVKYYEKSHASSNNIMCEGEHFHLTCFNCEFTWAVEFNQPLEYPIELEENGPNQWG